MPDHDVVIVGAGPVGLLLACLLAQSGIDVAVYERRVGADDRSRAIGIHPPGQDALEAIGVHAQVVAEALALDGGEVICGGRTLASLSFTGRQQVLILPQHRTHAVLTARLSQLSDAALHIGHEVLDVREEGDVVQLSVDTGGVRSEVTASFVVAADGVHSGIRQQLGIDWQERPGRGSYAMADIPDDGHSTRRAQLYCESAGLVESFPLPQGRRRWVATDTEGRLDEADAFANAVRARTGISLELPAGSHPTVFHARQHRAARTAAGRAVLLGDAAHETSPIGGQGMNLGWAAACRLSEAIKRSLRSGRSDFEEYERRTRDAARRAQRRSAFYMTMGHPAHGLRLGIRNTVIRAAGSAPFRDRMTGMITMRGL